MGLYDIWSLRPFSDSAAFIYGSNNAITTCLASDSRFWSETLVLHLCQGVSTVRRNHNATFGRGCVTGDIFDDLAYQVSWQGHVNTIIVEEVLDNFVELV